MSKTLNRDPERRYAVIWIHGDIHTALYNLAHQSRWFQVDPWPNDHWVITIKNEGEFDAERKRPLGVKMESVEFTDRIPAV